MTLIWTILIGFFVGLLARAIMPGRQISGCIITALLGIGGAVIGKFVGQALGFYQEGQPAGFLMSVVGALLILFIFHLFRREI